MDCDEEEEEDPAPQSSSPSSSTPSLSRLDVRRTLNAVRTLWDGHSPATPFCLSAHVQPGVTLGDFCVQFLISQRLRRSATAEFESGGR